MTLIKAPEPSFGKRLADINAMDDRITGWWQTVQPQFKLTTSNMNTVSPETLPRILYINIFYHQSLCSLHASIVPLFSGGAGEESWSLARQVSAQIAFDHACATSELLHTVLEIGKNLGAIPGFVAYAAYCGCAVQIPFMKCSNLAIKEKASANVMTNVRMMHAVGRYWRVAGSLVSAILEIELVQELTFYIGSLHSKLVCCT